MALTITPKLQKALEIASSIDEVVSVQAIEPPQNILDQIENKDSVYLDFVLQTNSGEIGFAIVVPNTLVEGVEDSLHIPIKDLLLCGCTQVEDGVGHICGYSVYDNIGKMTYYVRESDQYLVKLIDSEAPTAFIQSENLKKLVKKLEEVNQVNKILVEEIVDEKLKESLEAKSPVIIKAYIDVNNDMVTDHFVSFVVTELVYDIETSHEWAVNNLMDLIEKNNAE
jgi:hypothetical protein